MVCTLILVDPPLTEQVTQRILRKLQVALVPYPEGHCPTVLHVLGLATRLLNETAVAEVHVLSN